MSYNINNNSIQHTISTIDGSQVGNRYVVNHEKLIENLKYRSRVSTEIAEAAIKQALETGIITESENQITLQVLFFGERYVIAVNSSTAGIYIMHDGSLVLAGADHFRLPQSCSLNKANYIKEHIAAEIEAYQTVRNNLKWDNYVRTYCDIENAIWRVWNEIENKKI